jgi:hypothetical protein
MGMENYGLFKVQDTGFELIRECLQRSLDGLIASSNLMSEDVFDRAPKCGRHLLGVRGLRERSNHDEVSNSNCPEIENRLRSDTPGDKNRDR